MQLVPDWSPNIHPMIVHFPIVLLLLAVLLDISGLLLKKFNWVEKSALLLYILGTIAAAAAFFTGRAAFDSIDIPANVIPAINEHADWAEITLWFFIAFTVIRFSLLFFSSIKKIVLITIVLIGLIGTYFVYQTAEHGAKLVFGYGLGTANITNEESEKKKVSQNEVITDSSFTNTLNGSWNLKAAPDINKILSEKFNWIEGSPDLLNVMYDTGSKSLMLHSKNSALFLKGNKISSVQATTELKIDDFSGNLELIHHYSDSNNYDFLGIKSNEISLARKTNGKIIIFEKDNFGNKGWIELKVISDKTHFIGYINNKMIVHGHGSEPKPGSVGIKLSGNGIIFIRNIDVQSLSN